MHINLTVLMLYLNDYIHVYFCQKCYKNLWKILEIHLSYLDKISSSIYHYLANKTASRGTPRLNPPQKLVTKREIVLPAQASSKMNICLICFSLLVYLFKSCLVLLEACALYFIWSFMLKFIRKMWISGK